MNTFIIICQIVIAIGIVNVWLVRFRKPTRWRPAEASSMVEEFRHYGLPDWMRTVTGVTKLTLAALLLAGIWYTPLAAAAAAMMGVLMLGAVLAHARVNDPWFKYVPSVSLLVLSTVVALAYIL